MACGVRNGYDDPTRLGTDRWAAMVAAWQRGHAPCIVACAGTALTVDQLDDNGQFLGGAIVAGYHAMLGGWPAIRRRCRWMRATGRGRPTPVMRLAPVPLTRWSAPLNAGIMRLTQRLRERGSRVTPRIILTGGSAYRLLAHLPKETR